MPARGAQQTGTTAIAAEPWELCCSRSRRRNAAGRRARQPAHRDRAGLARDRLRGALARSRSALHRRAALIYLSFTGHATQTTTLVKCCRSTRTDRQGSSTGVRQRAPVRVDAARRTTVERGIRPSHSRFVALLALPSVDFWRPSTQCFAAAWLLVLLGWACCCRRPTTASYESLTLFWPVRGPVADGLVALAETRRTGCTLAARAPGLPAQRRVRLVARRVKFPFRARRVGEAARISSQHVSVGKWAQRASSQRARRIGVMTPSHSRTFGSSDLSDVGADDGREARSGRCAVSRFEHYERLPPPACPTHFIVYPAWFALPQFARPLSDGAHRVRDHPRRRNHGCVRGRLRGARLGVRAPLRRILAAIALDSVDVSGTSRATVAHGYVVMPAAQADDGLLSDGSSLTGARQAPAARSFASSRPWGRLVADRPDSPTTSRCAAQRLVVTWAIP